MGAPEARAEAVGHAAGYGQGLGEAAGAGCWQPAEAGQDRLMLMTELAGKPAPREMVAPMTQPEKTVSMPFVVAFSFGPGLGMTESVTSKCDL